MVEKFSRDQLVLAVNCLISAGARRMEKIIPAGLPLHEYASRSISHWEAVHGAVGTVYFGLKQFCANIAGKEIVSFQQYDQFYRLVEKFMMDRKAGGSTGLGNLVWLAESFVDEHFAEYLG